MDLTKKTTQKTSGIRKNYKPGQLITIDNCVFRIVKNPCRKDCLICWNSNCKIYIFCHELLSDMHLKPIKKHKG